MRTVTLGGCLAAFVLALSVWHLSAQTPADPVAAALTWHERPALEQALDPILKPADVMTLAGVRPGMKVVDLMPGSGYYSRIMSGIVGDAGQVYAFIPQSNGIGEMGPNPSPRVAEFGGRAQLTRLERAMRLAHQVNVARNTDVFWEWVDGKQYANDLR